MNIWRIIQLLLIGILVLAISSCKRDPLLNHLKDIKEKANAKGLDNHVQHVELAISKWQNRTVDSEPIVLDAALRKPNLILVIFDEDKDVIGFGIKEEHIDVNGLKTTFTEEYPAFVHQKWSDVMNLCRTPIQIRNVDQHKNSQRWDKYVQGDGIDVNDVRLLKYWDETLPTVWITIPEPNAVNVYVYLYDQKGHRSEPIKLLPPDSIENKYISIAMDYIGQKWPESLNYVKGLETIVTMKDGSCEVTFRMPKDMLGGVPVVVIDRQTKKVVHAHHDQ